MTHKFKVGDTFKLLPSCTKNCLPERFVGCKATVKKITDGGILVFDMDDYNWNVYPDYVEHVPDVVSGTLTIGDGGTYLPKSYSANVEQILDVYQSTGNLIFVEKDFEKSLSSDPTNWKIIVGEIPGESCCRWISPGVLCPGKIKARSDYERCQCSTSNPPCSYCTSSKHCDECGWDSEETNDTNLFKFC